MDIGVCVSHNSNTIDQSLKKITEMGFDKCQLISWDRTNWNDREADKICEARLKYDVEITAFWCGWRGGCEWNFYEGQETLGLIPLTYRYVRMTDLISGSDFAKKLNIEDVITHVGFIPENPHDPIYTGLIPVLRQIVQHYKENGQYFLFETGQETPVTLLRAIDDIGLKNIGLNLDPANLILYGKANPVDSLDVFGKYVRAVHAKDGLYPVNGRELGHETALGEGKVNFPALLQKLHDLGYNRSVTIEREIEGERQIHDILKGRTYLQNIINNLE
jgi:L-ribulose-5-phosphate 3-epimerase